MSKKFFGNQHVKSYWLKAKILGKRVAIVVVLLDAIGWSMTGAYYYAKATIKPETVKAEVRVEVPVESDIPILKRIAKCESGDSQYDKNGQVLMVGNENKSVDSGVLQINLTIWGKKAKIMGYDLSKESDNRAFGKYLFLNFGTEPWNASKACWSKG